MGWETGLGIALLLVGVGVYQALNPISSEITEWIKGRRESGGRGDPDADRLAALQEQVEELRERLELIEDRVDFNEALLRGDTESEAIGPPSERGPGERRSAGGPGGAGGEAASPGGAGAGEKSAP